MKKKILSIITSLFIVLISVSSVYGQEQTKKIAVVPVSGKIDSAAGSFIQRAVDEGIKNKVSMIIFEMDTFGGGLNAAYKIVDTIVNVPDDIKTVAFIKTKAISAGALISLACNRIYMKKSTTIGDCAPISYYNNQVQMLGEKFQSPLRAKFRTLAKKSGYSESLAESMVSENIEVYEIKYRDGSKKYMDLKSYNGLSKDKLKKITSKKVVVKKGELLTMDNSEAINLGFSKKTVETKDEILFDMDYKNTKYYSYKLNWSETLVNYILPFTPVLIIIGLIALFTEFKMPGFGFPGITAAICLSLAFGSQFLVGLANYTEFLIIAVGLILLILELFVIPGFGIAGVAGFCLIITGMVLSLQDFTIPTYPWQKELLFKNLTLIVSSVVIAFISGMLILRYVFPNLSIAKKGPYLTKTLEDSKADSFETLSVKVGDTAVAESYLRPSGKIKVNDDIIDAISEGEFLEKGTIVEVIKISGNRVIVSRKDL
ncbi:MAG: serine protease [Desulfobacterales bacterium]|nr:serine protease [Desulfobacterales bacterium]MCP4160659.1 serine protease [Deltaproteobacteria bacterium]